MKKKLLILSAMLFITMTVKAQHLFFIGENSLNSSNIMTLQSNSESQTNLELVYAKDGNKGFVGVNTKTAYTTETFVDKLIIYLTDGAVVTSTDLIASENVDKSANALFLLSAEDINKIKRADIHSVRYTLNFMFAETLYSATNKGINTSAIATLFYEGDSWDKIYNLNNSEINSRTASASSKSGSGSSGTGSGQGTSQGKTFPGGNQGVPTGDPNAGRYGPGGSGSGDSGAGSWSLAGRGLIGSLPKPNYPGNDAGKVVVTVRVNNNGKVISAEPGAQGTTLMNQAYWNEVKQAALKAKFNVDSKAPSIQTGKITYRFRLD